jgi:hypothetical protein
MEYLQINGNLYLLYVQIPFSREVHGVLLLTIHLARPSAGHGLNLTQILIRVHHLTLQRNKNQKASGVSLLVRKTDACNS